MGNPLRVLVADNFSITFCALSHLLDVEQYIVLPEQAASCAQAREYCRQYAPDVLVLAWQLANPYPDAVIGRFRQDFPAMRIVLIDDDDDDDDSQGQHFMGFGIAGFLRRRDSPEVWQRCFRVIAEGGTFDNRRNSSDLPANHNVHDYQTPGQLSERDIQLLRLLGCGYDNDEVAAQLNLSRHTVKNSLTALFKKLGVENRSQAIIWGMQAGILE
jgi:DNA-binding NarL/FixJ family response regulator